MKRYALIGLAFCMASSAEAAANKVSIQPATTYQTMTGWEATAQAGALNENDFTAVTPTANYNLNPAFAHYQGPLFDLAVNELGLNRIRLEIHTSAENSIDYFDQYLRGQINFNTYLHNFYNVDNDDGSPNTVNPAKFHFSELDFSIDHYVLPMKQRLAANGETLYVNLNVVDFDRYNRNYSLGDNPEEYAEFVLVTFQHIQGKYGWVPDAVEVTLEPENGGAHWTPAKLAAAMKAAQVRLSANGFSPKFIAPSVSFMENTVSYVDGMEAALNPGGRAWMTQYMSEIAYHLYGQSSTANRRAVRDAAALRNLKTSQLEFAGFGGAGGGTESDLREDLREANVSAWQQYAIAFPGSMDDRSQYYLIDQSNPNNPTISLGAQTKYFHQFFKYIRRGAVRIGASTNNSGVLDPLAFINANGSYVVVVKNWNSNAAFDVQNLPAGTYGITYTTDTQYKVALPDVTLTAGQELAVSGVSGSSVVTVYSKTLASTPPSVSFPDPILPQAFVDTTPPTQTGNTLTVNSGGNLQQALNNALPGDTIRLEAGAIFTAPDGGFVLPAKANPQNKWIVIQSSQVAMLPVYGNRVQPAHAVHMPKIVSGTNSPALATAPQASYYRFVGVEFGIPTGILGDANSGGGSNSALIMLGSTSETNVANQAHHIVMDRCYIHGNPGQNTKRGLYLNTGSVGVVGSYLSEFHDTGADAQAILVANGPGPFKFQNNYLEATGENIMFGGADVAIHNLIPGDAEILGNYFYKPLSWKAGQPGYNYDWVVKNLFELKYGARILIDGNIFENNWEDAQGGTAINLKSVNQDGGMIWAQTRDVTFRNNIVRHSARALSITAKDPPGNCLDLASVKVSNNLFDDITTSSWGSGAGQGRFLLVGGSITAVSIDHNTSLSDGKTIEATDLPAGSFRFTNNIIPLNEYGIKGDGQSSGNATIAVFFPASEFSRNALVGNGAAYPANNFYPPTIASVSFVNYNGGNGGNYRLSGLSLYRNAATDGTDVGASIDVIEARTICAVSGNCVVGPPDAIAPNAPTGLSLTSISSTSVRANWTAATDNVAVTGYRVDLSTHSSFTSFVSGFNNVDVGNVTTRLLSGLSAETTYYARARAYDGMGNTSVNSSSASAVTGPPTVVDLVAPVLSGISATGVMSSSATINWNSNELSTAQVEYGLTASYGQTTPLDSTLTLSHSVQLSGLSASTLYHYRVRSRDGSGNLATSADGTFTTLAPAAGAPLVPTLTLPSVLRLNQSVEVSYSGDPTGITFTWTFQFTGLPAAGHAPVAGAIAHAGAVSSPSASTSMNLATMNLTPGNYTVTVQAQNVMGNTVSAPANVTLVEANLARARVFPNPWRADQHLNQDVRFDQLTDNATVKIFTLSGQFVAKLSAPMGIADWNRRTESGDRVASGLYLYVISNGDDLKRGKLVLIQ